MYWFGDLNKNEELGIILELEPKDEGWGSLYLSISQMVSKEVNGIATREYFYKGISASDYIFIDKDFAKTSILILNEISIDKNNKNQKNIFNKIIDFFNSLF